MAFGCQHVLSNLQLGSHECLVQVVDPHLVVAGTARNPPLSVTQEHCSMCTLICSADDCAYVCSSASRRKDIQEGAIYAGLPVLQANEKADENIRQPREYREDVEAY